VGKPLKFGEDLWLPDRFCQSLFLDFNNFPMAVEDADSRGSWVNVISGSP
jgi:hypothetical protein